MREDELTNILLIKLGNGIIFDADHTIRCLQDLRLRLGWVYHNLLNVRTLDIKAVVKPTNRDGVLSLL